MAKKDINKDKKKSNFFKELKSELKKVTWPTFKKLVNNTSAVIAVVLIVSIIVFVLDVCFENLNDFGVGKIKSLVSSNTEETSETEETTEVEESSDLGDGIELVSDEENQDGESSEAEQSTEETNSNLEAETDNNSEEEVTQ